MYKTIAAFGCLLLAACGTTQTKLSYSPTYSAAKLSPDAQPLSVGTFSDQRGETPTWYGAIRGGFGNPLKVLESDKPIASIVQEAFANGVRARGMNPEGSSALQLSGVIRKLDCNQMVRREATVEIELVLTDTKSGRQRFKQTYSTYSIDGSLMSMKTGVFASVDDLRLTTEKALNETVDKALDDSAFRAALLATNENQDDSVSEKLVELEKLRKNGLISEQEFETKRQKVLNKF
jgi:hypothetical protein